MTIKKLFAFLFYFDKIDNFDNELQGAYKIYFRRKRKSSILSRALVV